MRQAFVGTLDAKYDDDDRELTLTLTNGDVTVILMSQDDRPTQLIDKHPMIKGFTSKRVIIFIEVLGE